MILKNLNVEFIKKTKKKEVYSWNFSVIFIYFLFINCELLLKTLFYYYILIIFFLYQLYICMQ